MSAGNWSRSRPYLANGSDLLWKDLRPDRSCKKNKSTQVVFDHCFCTLIFDMEQDRYKMDFPTEVFFEITFILTGVRPVIQLRP